MKTLKTACWMVLALLLAAPLQAAVVYLKDGTEVSGTVVSATANYVVVHTADGTQRITSDKIARIDYAQTATPPAGPPAAAPAPAPARPAGSEWQRLQTSGFDSRRQLFSIGLGLGVPLGNIDFNSIGGGTGHNGDVGLLVDGQYLFFKTPRLAFGGGLSYLHRSATDSTTMISSADTEVFGNTVLLQGLVRYMILEEGSARPYVQAGLGVHRTSTFIDATPSPGFAWSDTSTAETRRLVDDSHWGLGGSVAVGVDFAFAAPSVFSLEAGWTGLSDAKQDATTAGQALGLTSVDSPLDFVTFAARWGWRF